jgi:hypothetical protein
MTDLAVAADLRDGAAPVDGAQVSVSFSMEGMFMGENTTALAHAGPGRFQGKAVLVRCPSGREDWTAEVTVARPGRPAAAARFPLSVVE